jgi:DNA-directed RNA polymerase subunit RPC12/RpoP
MIGFSCKNCGYNFSVQDDYSGKRIKCPMCGFVGVVVDDSGKIKITCQNCGNENNVPKTHAGKKINCPKCNNLVEVPSDEKEPAENADNNLNNKIPETLNKSEITERNLIIIITAIAAFIVIGLIIIAAVRNGN